MKMEVKMRMIWGSQIKEQPLGAAKCKELDSALEPPEGEKKSSSANLLQNSDLHKYEMNPPITDHSPSIWHLWHNLEATFPPGNTDGI